MIAEVRETDGGGSVLVLEEQGRMGVRIALTPALRASLIQQLSSGQENSGQKSAQNAPDKPVYVDRTEEEAGAATNPPPACSCPEEKRFLVLAKQAGCRTREHAYKVAHQLAGKARGAAMTPNHWRIAIDKIEKCGLQTPEGAEVTV